jgi:hypothetical protein
VAVRKSYVKDGVLYCFYEIANFDQVISEALKEHGLEADGKIQIICKPLPDPDRCIHGMMSASVCHFCKGGQPSKDTGGKLPSWLKG